VAGGSSEERSAVGNYLPWDDVLRYLLLILGDAGILVFWWFVMSHLGDV
jgi:hypothetical protein